jgi:hypothetical protein
MLNVQLPDVVNDRKKELLLCVNSDEVLKVMNDYYSTIVWSLELTEWQKISDDEKIRLSKFVFVTINKKKVRK